MQPPCAHPVAAAFKAAMGEAYTREDRALRYTVSYTQRPWRQIAAATEKRMREEIALYATPFRIRNLPWRQIAAATEIPRRCTAVSFACAPAATPAPNWYKYVKLQSFMDNIPEKCYNMP